MRFMMMGSGHLGERDHSARANAELVHLVVLSEPVFYFFFSGCAVALNPDRSVITFAIASGVVLLGS